MKLTIEPTDQFFMHVGIPMRAWQGAFEDGTEATALVAAVSACAEPPAGVIGLTPIPPPAAEWSPHVRYLMTRVWQLGDRLTDKEANDLALLAEGWVEGRERKERRATSSGAL